MTFYHGISTSKVPSALLPARQIDSALTVAFGCAPIHRLDPGQQALAAPGQLVPVTSDVDCTQKLGCDLNRDDFSVWGLSEVAYSHFELFTVGSLVCVNLFDPAVHNTIVTAETVQITNGVGQLANTDIFAGTLVLDTYIAGTDYLVNLITGAISVPSGSSMPTTTNVVANYTCAAPEKVTPADCIGGYDIQTGETTGLSLVEHVFPKFRVPPAILIAPGFSEDVTVAAIMAAKTQNINSVFSCFAYLDIPSDGANGVTVYSNVAQYKQDKNLVNPNTVVCWPKVSLGGRVMHLSTQEASVTASTDAVNGGVPFASPSNNNVQCDALVAGGQVIVLGNTEANILNANGIVTVLNFVDGYKSWGDRTACFPDNTDVAFNFLAIGRMIAWYRNRLTLTWWQKVDWPLVLRLAQTIVSSEQININAMASAQQILGGKIAFNEASNNTLDLMNGKAVFDCSMGFASPAEWIHFNVQYDASYLATLFA